jgi:hypothetical protein
VLVEASAEEVAAMLMIAGISGDGRVTNSGGSRSQPNQYQCPNLKWNQDAQYHGCHRFCKVPRPAILRLSRLPLFDILHFVQSDGPLCNGHYLCGDYESVWRS